MLNTEELYHLVDLVRLHTQRVKDGLAIKLSDKAKKKLLKFDKKLIKKIEGMLDGKG